MPTSFIPAHTTHSRGSIHSTRSSSDSRRSQRTATSERRSSGSSETEWTETGLGGIEEEWAAGDSGKARRRTRPAETREYVDLLVVPTAEVVVAASPPSTPRKWWKGRAVEVEESRASLMSLRGSEDVPEFPPSRCEISRRRRSVRTSSAPRDISPCRLDRLTQTFARSRMMQIHVRRQWWDVDVSTLIRQSYGLDDDSDDENNIDDRSPLPHMDDNDDNESDIDIWTPPDDEDLIDHLTSSLNDPISITITDARIENAPVLYTTSLPSLRTEAGRCTNIQVPYGSESCSELLVENNNTSSSVPSTTRGHVKLQTTHRLHPRHAPPPHRRAPRWQLTVATDITSEVASAVQAEVRPRKKDSVVMSSDDEDENHNDKSLNRVPTSEEAAQHAHLTHLTPESSTASTATLRRHLTALQRRYESCAIVLLEKHHDTSDESETKSTRISIPYLSAALGRPSRSMREALIEAVARQSTSCIEDGEEKEVEAKQRSRRWDFETQLTLEDSHNGRDDDELVDARVRCIALFDSLSNSHVPGAWACFLLPD